jgi:hypothetical protein
MKQNIKQTKKNFESELNNPIIWGARSITIQLNNNCSPKLYNKDFSCLYLVKETRDNIDQVVPVSQKFNFNEDIL